MARRRYRTLEQTVAAVHLRYGPAALVKASGARQQVPALPTGFAALDEALGIGGLPRGQVSELGGPLTAGKTTLAARLLAQAQRLGEGAAYIDLAGAADPDYLARCGVDLARLPFIRPHDGRQALEIALALAGRRELGLLVLDAPGDLGQALGGRWTAGDLRQLLGQLRRSPCALLALQHGQAGAGAALSAHAWLRLQVQSVRWRRRGQDVCGYDIDLMILRHRGGREGRRVRLRIDLP